MSPRVHPSPKHKENLTHQSTQQLLKISEYVERHFNIDDTHEHGIESIEMDNSTLSVKYHQIGVYVARALRNMKTTRSVKVAPAPATSLIPPQKGKGELEVVRSTREIHSMIEHQERKASLRGSIRQYHAYISQNTIREETQSEDEREEDDEGYEDDDEGESVGDEELCVVENATQDEQEDEQEDAEEDEQSKIELVVQDSECMEWLECEKKDSLKEVDSEQKEETEDENIDKLVDLLLDHPKEVEPKASIGDENIEIIDLSLGP